MPTFLNTVNLDQNELQNAVIHKSTSATRPATPVIGQVTYDTDDKKIYTWDGSTWVATSSGAVTSITGTSPINATGTTSVTISVDSAGSGTLGVIALSGDLGGTATSLSVTGVGAGTANATSAATIKDAADKRHTQNTDTGTTSATFQIDSTASGPKLKNSGGELVIRDAADGTFAPVRTGNLHVEGTLTYVHSEEVLIADNAIELNSNIDVSTSNTDGGVIVRRVLADAVGTGTISGSTTTITGVGTSFQTDYNVGDVLIFGAQRRRITAIAGELSLTVETAFSPQPSADNYSVAEQASAQIYFDNTNGVWKVVNGATTSLQTHQVARKYSTAIGDGVAKVYVVTHNMNTRDVNVTVRQVASPYAHVLPDVESTSVNTVTVTFNKVVTSNQYQVTVLG